MRVVLRGAESFVLELTTYECHMIAGSLNHATVTDDEEDFRRRFGWPNGGDFPTRGELRAIRDRLPRLRDGDAHAVWTEGFTRREMIIVVRSLSELANGVQLTDWEFPLLRGAPRQDVRDLLHAVHRAVVG